MGGGPSKGNPFRGAPKEPPPDASTVLVLSPQYSFIATACGLERVPEQQHPVLLPLADGKRAWVVFRWFSPAASEVDRVMTETWDLVVFLGNRSVKDLHGERLHKRSAMLDLEGVVISIFRFPWFLVLLA